MNELKQNNSYMSRYFLSIFLIINQILFCFVLKAQNLPKQEIVSHLVKSHEIDFTNSIEASYNNIHVNPIFDHDSVAMYVFFCNSVHRYQFLLLKSSSKYLILNCADFIPEYKIIKDFYGVSYRKFILDRWINIINVFEENFDYHPTPPYPNLKKLKDANGNIQKSIYPPRKLIHTEPFIFNAE